MEILKILLYIIIAYFSYRLIKITYKFLKWLFFPPYEQKIVLVVGETGAGKTSKVVADAIKYNKKMRRIQIKELSPIYEAYKSSGYAQINIPETFIYSDIDIALKGKLPLAKQKATDYRFEWLSSLIYNKEKELLKLRKDFLPIGALGVFDEIANKVDSRNSQSLDDGFSALLRLHRKYYLNFYFIYPQFMDADKRVRNNCHEIQKVIKLKHFKFRKKIIASKWTYISYTGIKKQADCESGKSSTQVSTLLKRFLGIKSDIEIKTKWFFGNIFDRYESRAEISYFMKGVNNFREVKQLPFEYSREYTQYYNKAHPAFMPPERQKRKSEERKRIKELKENAEIRNRNKQKTNKQ